LWPRIFISLFSLLLFISCNSELPQLNRISKRLPFSTQLGTKTKFFADANLGSDFCLGVAIDKHENIICVGATSGRIGAQHTSNPGWTDAFVLKLDRFGKILWAQQLAAPENGSGEDLVIDSADNIYVLVSEYDGVSSNFFQILKYSPSGNLLWTKTFTNPGNYDYAPSISLHPSGDLLIAGQTKHSWGDTNAGDADAFVARLSPQGEIIWVYQRGQSDSPSSTLDDVTMDVASSPDGMWIYALGYTLINGSPDHNDIFIMKIRASDGQRITEVTFGSSDLKNEFPNGLAVARDGSLHFTGITSGSLIVPSLGNDDIFYYHLNSDLNVLDAQQFGSPQHDRAYDLKLNSKDEPIVIGQTRGSIAETNSGTQNAFIWSPGFQRQIGLESKGLGIHSECYGLAIDKDDNIYCAGSTSSSFSEPNAGNLDILIFRLSPDGSGKI
jgi:hypothetical protein